MEPKILLSANQRMELYVDAVNNCGGIADASYCPEVSLDYDGLLICGGNDIDPEYYGEEMNGAVNIDEQRDVSEIALAKAFIEAGKPVMGICRGAQLLNVVLGGSLHQHIHNADIHTSGGGPDLAHNASAVEDSVCYRLYGAEFPINSAHHQAIKDLGEGLRVTMTSDDIIEGFEHTSLPIIGVQWHPERMCFTKKREDTVDGAAVIRYFVDMCKKG